MRMINFANDCDSTNFCKNIIGQTMTVDNEFSIQEKLVQKKLSTSAYNLQVKTIMKACMAAFNGDL